MDVGTLRTKQVVRILTGPHHHRDGVLVLDDQEELLGDVVNTVVVLEGEVELVVFFLTVVIRHAAVSTGTNNVNLDMLGQLFAIG